MKVIVYDLGSIVDWISAIGAIITSVLAIYLLFRDKFGKLVFYSRESNIELKNEDTVDKMIETCNGSFYHKDDKNTLYHHKEALITLEGIIEFDLYNKTGIHKAIGNIEIEYDYGNNTDYCHMTDMEGNKISTIVIEPYNMKNLKVKFVIENSSNNLYYLKDKGAKFYFCGEDERGKRERHLLVEYFYNDS